MGILMGLGPVLFCLLVNPFALTGLPYLALGESIQGLIVAGYAMLCLADVSGSPAIF